MDGTLRRLVRGAKSRLADARPTRLPPRVDRFDTSPGSDVRQPITLASPAPPPVQPPHIWPRQFSTHFQAGLPAKFETWTPLVAAVDDARIVGHGRGVVDASGHLVMESLWDDEHYRREFRGGLPSPSSSFDGTAVSLLSLWDDNYYHWLVDALPRLGVLAASGLEFAVAGFVVPHQQRGYHRESLELLGISSDKQVPFDGSSLRVRRLVWPSAAAPIGHCSPFIVRWLRESFLRAEASGRRRRIYLARRVRKVANDAAVWSVLSDFGFEGVYAEDLTFEAQIELFSRAEMVVGPHGAGMVNSVFARQACVLEMFQPNYINTGLFEVSRAAGHTYWAIVGTPERSPGDAKDADMSIDVDALRHALAEMEGVVGKSTLAS